MGARASFGCGGKIWSGAEEEESRRGVAGEAGDSSSKQERGRGGGGEERLVPFAGLVVLSPSRTVPFCETWVCLVVVVIPSVLLVLCTCVVSLWGLFCGYEQGRDEVVAAWVM